MPALGSKRAKLPVGSEMAVKLFDGGMVSAVISAPAMCASVSLMTRPSKRTCAERVGGTTAAIRQQKAAKVCLRSFVTMTGLKVPP